MKTLFVFSTASTYGGAERSVELLLPPLSRSFRLVVFTENAQHGQRVEHCAAQCNFSHVWLRGGKRPGDLIGNVLGVRAMANDAPPDLLVSNTNKGALLAGLLRRSLARPAPLGVWIRDFQWQFRRTILSLAAPDIVFVPTRAVLDHPTWHTLLSKRRVAVIPSPVELSTQPTFQGEGKHLLCLAILPVGKAYTF